MWLIFCMYNINMVAVFGVSVEKAYLRRGKLAEAVWRGVHTPAPRPSYHYYSDAEMIRSGPVEPGSSLV